MSTPTPVAIRCPDCLLPGQGSARLFAEDPEWPDTLRVQMRDWWLPCTCALAYPGEERIGYEVEIARQVQASLDESVTPAPASAR